MRTKLREQDDVPFARSALHGLTAELTARAGSFTTRASFRAVLTGCVASNLHTVSDVCMGRIGIAYLLPSAFVAGTRHLGSFAIRIVGVVRIVVSLHAHDMLRHLLRRMRWACRSCEVLMRAHGGSHMSHLLVLRLLRTGWMHHVSTLTQLL